MLVFVLHLENCAHRDETPRFGQNRHHVTHLEFLSDYAASEDDRALRRSCPERRSMLPPRLPPDSSTGTTGPTRVSIFVVHLPGCTHSISQESRASGPRDAFRTFLSLSARIFTSFIFRVFFLLRCIPTVCNATRVQNLPTRLAFEGNLALSRSHSAHRLHHTCPAINRGHLRRCCHRCEQMIFLASASTEQSSWRAFWRLNR